MLYELTDAEAGMVRFALRQHRNHVKRSRAGAARKGKTGGVIDKLDMYEALTESAIRKMARGREYDA